MGASLRVEEWVFPQVEPSYDEKHPLLVQFPVRELGMEAPGLLLGLLGWPRCDLRSLSSLTSRCIILFHANGYDIGQCKPDMITFRDGFFDGDAVVFCPEYPGYGLLSDYKPSCEGVDLIATAAWRFCREALGFESRQIALCGRSIGTGPATRLAHRLACQGTKGQPAVPGRNRQSAGMVDMRRPPSVPVRTASSRFQGPPKEDDDGCACTPSDPLETIVEMTEEDLCSGSPRKSELASDDEDQYNDVASEADSSLPTPRTRRSVFEAGMEVLVIHALPADSSETFDLEPGQRGWSTRVDEHGNMLVHFDGDRRPRWVMKKHFHLMSIERCLGALILIAPMTSVADVVHHHVPSDMAYALFDSMWDSLGCVRDERMKQVPLLLIHPKSDEIVPPEHGRRLVSEASCRNKFGIWLKGSKHNVFLEEEHLLETRGFMTRMMPSGEFEPKRSVLETAGGSPLDIVSSIADRLIELGQSGKAEEVMSSLL